MVAALVRAGEPLATDDDLITLWGLVVEGYAATGALLQPVVTRELGLAVPEVEVLLRLLRTPGHRLSSGALARESSMTGGGLTRMVDRLVGAGLVQRVSCPQDRRVIWVQASPAGLARSRRARRLLAAVIRRDVVGVLGEEQAAALGAAMRLLRDTHHGSGATLGVADRADLPGRARQLHPGDAVPAEQEQHNLHR